MIALAPIVARVALTPTQLGSRISEERQKHGWKPEDLAYFAGITPSYLTRIEAGGVEDPGYSLLSRIAVALDFSGVDALVGDPVITKAELEEFLLERFRRPGSDSEVYAKQLAQQTLADEHEAKRGRSRS